MDLGYLRLKMQLRYARRRRPEPTDAYIAETRALFDAVGASIPIPDGVSTAAVDVDGVVGEWVVPDGADDVTAVLYLHGGAYVFGSIDASRDSATKTLRAIGRRGLLIDYRLGPEAPFPGAVDDAVTAYTWLLANGFAADAIAIVGDSAGGGLAVATALALRDRGLPQPGVIAGTSSWADLALAGASYRERRHRDLALDVAMLEHAAGAYLGTTAPTHPLASPVYADLTGLAPLVLLVGTEEVVYDDSITLAANAEAAGVDVEVLVAEGMLHCWTGYVDKIRRAQRDLDWLGERVRARLGNGGDGDRAAA